MSDILLLLISVLGILGSFLCFWALNYYNKKKVMQKAEIDAAPVVITDATVLSKTHTNAQTMQPIINNNYLVSFEMNNALRRNFTLTLEQFNLLIEGDTGVLSYKLVGEVAHFVEFKPNARTQAVAICSGCGAKFSHGEGLKSCKYCNNPLG